MRHAMKNVVKINRNGDMWYIFIPKAVKQDLESKGFRLKDLVIFEKVEFVSENEARIELRIVRSGEGR